jgi:hypothetical protein
VKTNDPLVAAFDHEMVGIYRRALSEANYKATRFFHMLDEHGGVETAKILINAERESEGYTALWGRKRLDLTVEAVIHDNSKWHPLFTASELAKCRARLTKYNYFT